MVAAASNSSRLVGVSALFFFFSLFLTAYSARNPELGGIGYRMIDELVRPFQTLHHGVFSSISNIWSDYINLRGVREQNALLLERAQALESRNSALLEYEFENRSLRDLLAMKKSQKLEGQVATVIGYDPSIWQRAIVVDKGLAQGIAVGMAVVSGSGLVGQVTSVGRRSARVLLVTDPLSGVDALIQGNRARGIIEGNGNGSCSWKFVLREEDIKIGDRVTSSGLDGVYPRGLLVGIITEISSRPDSMFHDVVVRPSIDMEKIESVYIVSSQRSEVR